MTEEEVRAIVRDEVELECIKEGGIYDQTRSTAFKVVETITDRLAKELSGLFSRSEHGPN